MNNKPIININQGVGFCEALFFIFLTLKLTNYIDWSWVWILSPLWIKLVVVMILEAIKTIRIFQQ